MLFMKHARCKTNSIPLNLRSEFQLSYAKIQQQYDNIVERNLPTCVPRINSVEVSIKVTYANLQVRI